MNLRRVLTLTAVALCALPLTACGNKEAVHTFGHTEGTYVTVGDLVYQVQISRLLNPSDAGDRSYLIGLPLDQRELAPDEAWFAVFVTAWNEGDKSQPSASDFSVVDTQENVFRPVVLSPDNAFAFRPGTIPGGGQLPELGSVAAGNPSVNGGLLLFKMKNATFDNRPLELKIRGLGGEPREAAVDLDV